MKKLLYIFSTLLILFGCRKEYRFDDGFSIPTTLSGPSEVLLDVTSSDNVILSWTGGGADDGGIVLYTVLFDKAGGDFTNPVYSVQSDYGSKPQLTLSHATLNMIARNAGIATNSSGVLTWAVSVSKGGKTEISDISERITVTRGEGIDNMPENLYIQGSAALEAGQKFRLESEGLYVIHTKIGAGALSLNSEKDGSGNAYFATDAGKLVEGTGEYNIDPASSTGIMRITVDFNSFKLTFESLENLRAAWGANGETIFDFQYAGDGRFSGEGDVVFLQPGDISWLSWVEERYYFLVDVDGVTKCWGRLDGVTDQKPDGSANFYDFKEYVYSQWEHLWKFADEMDGAKVEIVIDTDKDGVMTHTVTKK